MTTRVDRLIGDRRVPQGAVGRVVASDGAEFDVQIVGVGVARYQREKLVPRKLGQVRFAERREAAWRLLKPCTVLEATVGSRAWGLADESSDIDVRGAFVLPFPWTSGLAEPPHVLVSADGSATLWEIDAVVRQAVRADPNTLEMLYVRSAVALDPMGEWLLEARDAFVTTEIYGTNRNRLSEDILRDVKETASCYGVAILRADIKDLVFPGNLQEIMNKVLAAERNAQAQLVDARTKARASPSRAHHGGEGAMSANPSQGAGTWCILEVSDRARRSECAMRGERGAGSLAMGRAPALAPRARMRTACLRLALGLWLTAACACSATPVAPPPRSAASAPVHLPPSGTDELERSAAALQAQGAHDRAGEAYADLLRRFPSSPRACRWQHAILESTRRLGGKHDVAHELHRLVTRVDQLRRDRTLAREELTECERSTRTALREVTLAWHKEAQKTEDPDTRALAEYGYRAYLERFRDDEDAGLMAYYHADLLFVLASRGGAASVWREAADMFERAIAGDPQGRVEVKTRDGKKRLVPEAAFGAVYCLMRAERIDVEDEERETTPRPQRRQADEADYKPLPISPNHQRLLRVFDTYLRLVPREPERARVLYHKGRILYEANRFKEAAAVFEVIVTQHRTDELAITAANLLLNCLEHQKKYREIAEWVVRMLGMPEFRKDEEFRRVLETIRAGIQWRLQ